MQANALTCEYKYSLKLEWESYLGDQKIRSLGRFIKMYMGNVPQYRIEQEKFWYKPWVAEIVGLDEKYKFKRTFLNGKIDFGEANSKFSRYVYLYFILEPGKIYQVKGYKKYYCRIEKGELVVITEKEALECVKNT